MRHRSLWNPLALLWLLLLASPAPAQQTTAAAGEWRQWTLDGKTKVEAVMRGVDSGNVILQSRDGRAATMPLARLGSGDRAYVRAAIGGLVLEAMEKANAGPAVSASLGAAAAPAARSGWQGGVKADPANCEVSEMPRSGGKWQQAFRSLHFEFHSTAKLPLERRCDVARLFEVQYELHRRAGWGVGPALEGGARLKIELYDTEDAYAASGALPATGCDLDHRTGILRCTLEAAGLHAAEGEWIMDSVLTPKAVARGVALMVLSDAIELLPLWVLNGMAACMGAIPVTGGTAWPDRAIEGMKPHAERAGGAAALDFASLLAVPEPAAPPATGKAGGSDAAVASLEALARALAAKSAETSAKKKVSDYATAALLACYFIFLDSGSHASRLAGVISAARTDQARWDAYDRAMEKYTADWAAIKARKDVVDRGGGQFSVPSSVTVPKAPEPPDDITSRLDLRSLHAPKLLGGAEPSAVAQAAKAALAKAGL